MSTRERFGKYLLLKKLTEDPLGETFRAGMLGKEGIERVVLLRIFNGQAIDAQRLWDATKDHGAVHDLLRSPNFGEGVEFGELQGIPYIAYEYISGKNLAVLLEQAARKNHFIPTEHALLITERIALALVVASESRFQGDKLSHGFLVPHLVMISNEGETRLIGFEVAKGTRGFAANPLVRRHFGRYLAPEALSGAPPHRSDDVYSLGVMLFELLTGRPLPPPAQDGYGSVIDAGTLATEGTPIPPDLVQLLKQSLVAREQRIPDAQTWHKTLNKWMFDGQYNPTTFNLAFYMHNLFREEIERESQEIEVEKTLSLPVVQQPQAPAQLPEAVATQPMTPIPPQTSDSGEMAAAPPPYAQDSSSKSKGPLIGLIAAILLLGAGAAYFFMQGGEAASTPEPQAAAQPAPAPAPQPNLEEMVDTGPSEEELALKKQIEDLIAQQASDMEEKIRSDYDQQLKQLQDQLEGAKEKERQRQEAELAALKAQQEETERLKAEEEAKKQAEEQRLAEEAAKAAEEEEALAAASTPEDSAEEAAPVQTAQKSPPPPAPQPTAPPRAPQVRRGDLVEMGPGVEVPNTLRRAQPRFPEMARRLNKAGATVLVRVLIDENGEVVKAELAGEKQGFGFDAEALQAAKKSTYAPATKNGVPVKMWHTLSVVFRR